MLSFGGGVCIKTFAYIWKILQQFFVFRAPENFGNSPQRKWSKNVSHSFPYSTLMLSGRLGSGRWVVSLFFERCNLHEAVIHFTSYNSTALSRKSRAGGEGPWGPRRGRFHRHVHQTAWAHSQHPCVQNCRRGGRGDGEQIWELVWELAATLQQFIFEAAIQKEAQGSPWVTWHQCLDSMIYSDGLMVV